MLFCFLTLALAQEPSLATRQQAVARERAFFGQVALSVSIDSKTHYVGEPVRLRVIMRNAGSTSVNGYLAVRPYQDTAEFYYRRPGERFRRFVINVPGEDERDVEIAPTVLAPQAEHTSEVTLAFDPKLGTSVLAMPGIFEFKVIYKGIHKIRGKPIESNVASVTCAAPPAAHEEAYMRYMSSGLARMAQFDPFVFGAQAPTVNAAREFVEQYPNSPYTAPVRQGLFKYLADRVGRKHATGDEKRLYDALKANGEQ